VSVFIHESLFYKVGNAYKVNKSSIKLLFYKVSKSNHLVNDLTVTLNYTILNINDSIRYFGVEIDSKQYAVASVTKIGFSF